MNASPPIHQAGQCAGRNRVNTIAVRRIPKASTTPPRNHTTTRAATCTPRAMESRGRSQLRKHTSSQWPPNEGQSTNKVAIGHRPGRPPQKRARMAPPIIAIAPVRKIVVRRGSRQGCHCDVIPSQPLPSHIDDIVWRWRRRRQATVFMRSSKKECPAGPRHFNASQGLPPKRKPTPPDTRRSPLQ